MDDRGIVRRAAELLTGFSFEPWFYGDSVGIEGLLAASAMLGDPVYEGFCRGLARGALARDPVPRPTDNTVPGRVLVELAVRTGDTPLLDRLGRLHDQLRARPLLHGVPVSLDPAGLLRAYGGVPMPADEVRLLADPGPAVYVDCLHFDPTFTAALAVATGSESLLDAALDQAAAFVDLLADPITGLFHHFHLGRTATSYVLGWSRGQGWALLGLLDVLESAAQAGREAPVLAQAVRRCLGAMAERQRADGDWGAVVVRPQSPPETSAAAFVLVAALRARRLGVIGGELDQTARRAETAMRSHVDPDGRLLGVSGVVWSSTRSEHYDHVTTGHLVPWGQGPLILALRELALAADGGT